MRDDGFAVSSNAASYRMFDDVPLVIPEVNSEHQKLVDAQRDNRGWSGFIVTNPNCSTIMLCNDVEAPYAAGAH